MKKHILMALTFMLSCTLAAQPEFNHNQAINIIVNQSDLRTERPILLFDTSVLNVARVEQKVMSYSKSNEMSDIRKAFISLREVYNAQGEILRCHLNTAESNRYNTRYPDAQATYNQRVAEIDALTEKYHAQKTALNTQEKNVYKKIKIIIDKIAKRWEIIEFISYDSNVTMSPYLTYIGRPIYDITDEVIETLNKEYRNF